MQRYETTLTIPCNVGDRFWLFDKIEKQSVQVECTGYVISKDAVMERDSAYIWVDGITARGQWRIPFHEFYNKCYSTKKEAEHRGRR